MWDTSRVTASVHALFPGSFDPFTLGHLELVERATALFARVTVGVAHNAEKRTLFSVEERLELVRQSVRAIERVDACIVHGLVVDACREMGARAIVRGVRSGSDFDYELEMARTNRELASAVDTVLLVPGPAHSHVSSTLVRQIAALGGDVAPFVPRPVAEALRRRFERRE